MIAVECTVVLDTVLSSSVPFQSITLACNINKVSYYPDLDKNKAKLLRCFPRYRAANVILRKNTDYTDDEISLFQQHIDAWFCDWVDMYGKEGCTNYTHMLSSSHIMRYMHEWRRQYRYSQQGWEALNALMKAYFFRRTNRGGLCPTRKVILCFFYFYFSEVEGK